MDGVITRVVANKGSVTRAGDPIVELYGNQHFVLGYVPTGTLYRVAVGDEVQIRTGLQTSRGTITRVEPVAAALPREFQRSFAPVETQQLIRVEFAPGEAPPPLFTKVNLRSDNIIPRWVYRIWRKWTWVSSSDPQNVERYHRLLGRVADESDRQKISNLLAVERTQPRSCRHS
jgi:hypothetical protein